MSCACAECRCAWLSLELGAGLAGCLQWFREANRSQGVRAGSAYFGIVIPSLAMRR